MQIEYSSNFLKAQISVANVPGEGSLNAKFTFKETINLTNLTGLTLTPTQRSCATAGKYGEYSKYCDAYQSQYSPAYFSMTLTCDNKTQT